jgi:hypothetical protein
MFVATCAMFGQFLSLIACYYYAKAIEDAQLFETSGNQGEIEEANQREKFWKRLWNYHWKFFAVGIGASILATISRFIGQ